MPFVRWHVQPTLVGRAAADDVNPDDPLEWTTNGTLVAVLRQLASIARCADRVFDEVAVELFAIYDRTHRLTSRVEKLEVVAKALDAKKVSVPLSDLTSFSEIREHFHAEQPLDSTLFSEDRRPLCVQLLYNDSLVSPVHIMREIDPLRQDGQRTSKYFVCTPVFGDDKKRQSNIDLEIEMRRPSSACVVRDNVDEVDEDIDSCHSSITLLRLPLPEEQSHAFSLKYPYSDVPIDTTGSGFRRMASFRRSLIQHVEFLTRKKKKKKSKSDRRNTISDTDDIKIALNNHKHETILSKARKRFSMAESSGSCKENLFKQAYSSLRKPSASKSVQTGEETPSEKSFSGSRQRRSRNYDSLPFRRSKEITNEVDVESSECESMEKNARAKSKSRKSLIPIGTLSQVAVKMRDSTMRSSKKEDSGQSSSGNWSASSSTRTSVESEKIPNDLLGSTRVPSQTSLSKDSALSDQTSPYDDMPSYDSYQSDVSAGNSASLKKSKHNVRSNSKNQAKIRETDIFSNSDVTDETSTTGTLTPLLGNRALSPFDMPMAFMDDEESSVYSVDTDGYYTSMHTDSGLRSMSSSTKPLDKDSNSSNDNTHDNSSTLSSVSSLEQAEYDDKNVRHSTGTIIMKKVPPQPPARNSSLGNNGSEGSSRESEDTKNSSSDSDIRRKPSRSCSSPTSESDAEARETIRRKTAINTSRIPSMCIVTPNPSDDEEEERANKHDGMPYSNKDSVPVEENLISNNGKKDIRVDVPDMAYRTVPRNFERRTMKIPTTKYSTHSWPRSLTNTGLASKPHYMSVNSNIPKLSSFISKKHLTIPEQPAVEQQVDNSSIPLKYVQHITVTPGGKIYQTASSSGANLANAIDSQEKCSQNNANGSLERKTSLTNDKKVTEVSQSKVIYATNSLERKSRPGAHVTLDPSGKVVTNQTKVNDVPSVENNRQLVSANSGTPGGQQANKTSNPQILSTPQVPSGSEQLMNMPDDKSAVQSRPFVKSYSFRGLSNTLPRTSFSETSPPPLNLPRNLSSSTFPRRHNTTKSPIPSKGSSSSSIDSQSSKGSPNTVKSSMPALPPPMSLMSPSKSQVSRRWPCANYGPPPRSNANNEPQLNIPTMLYSSNHQVDGKSFSPASTPLYSSPAPAPNINTVGLPASAPTPIYSRSLIPNGDTRRENAYSSVKQPCGQYNANHVPAIQRSLPTYARCLSPLNNKMTPPYVNPPNVQNHRPPTPAVNNQPPPPPSRQYRLIQNGNSLESSTPSPQYTIMRTSTPVNTNVSMVPRRLEWSMNTPETKGANYYNQFPNGYQDKSTIAKHSPLMSNGSFHQEQKTTMVQRMDQKPNGFMQQSQSLDRLTNGRNQDKKSSMSAKDLFAVIHQSKKRLNMKLDSETSTSPISSRSASPALSVCSQPCRSSGPETGMLSPRSLPGDRRSWAGDPSSPIRNGTATLPGDRKSWAIDRLGPTKPTTMHDFKLLLLQAGRGNNVQEQNMRRSASEMLKVSAQKQQTLPSNQVLPDRSMMVRSPVSKIISSDSERTYDAPTNTPPRNVRQSWTMLNQNSPSQYGRSRMRTPFHTRTDILSMPIIEDHLEDELGREENDKNQRYMEMSTDFANANRKFPQYRQNGLYKFTEKKV